MIETVSFIDLEEGDKDLILSFALEEEGDFVRSLILHRTLFCESILPEEERGTIVHLEGEQLEEGQEYLNTLEEFVFDGTTIRIKSRFSHYMIDARKLDIKEFKTIEDALKRQNLDARFQIKFT